jgi:hypothetical protein
MSNSIRKLLLGLHHPLKTHHYIRITENHLPLGLRIHAEICHSYVAHKILRTAWGSIFSTVQKMVIISCFS